MYGKIENGALTVCAESPLDDGDWRPLTDVWPDRAPSAIETLTGPEIVISADAVTRLWSLALLPEQEIQRRVVDGVQRHLDASVSPRGYSSAASAISYLNDPNPTWSAEAAAVLTWRSGCWQVCYDVQVAVRSRNRIPLTPDEMVAELPPLVWPD